MPRAASAGCPGLARQLNDGLPPGVMTGTEPCPWAAKHAREGLVPRDAREVGPVIHDFALINEHMSGPTKPDWSRLEHSPKGSFRL
jgi:hypothetical protein